MRERLKTALILLGVSAVFFCIYFWADLYLGVAHVQAWMLAWGLFLAGMAHLFAFADEDI